MVKAVLKMMGAAAVLALAGAALAQEGGERNGLLPSTIGLHLGSRHVQPEAMPSSRGWNDANYGGFVGWRMGQTRPLGMALDHMLVVGTLRNSLFELTRYIGVDTTSPMLQTWLGGFALAATVNLMDGYDDYKAEFTGQAFGASQRLRNRCNAALGCRNVVTKPALLLALIPGVDFQPALPGLAKAARPVMRLSYLHDSGDAGGRGVHLTMRWVFE